MTEGAQGASVPDSAWAPAAPAPGRDAIGLPGYGDFVEIARGGDSVVYRARQKALDRFVAVKTVDVEGSSGGARFTRELEITLGLGRQHPHIVTVLDTGTTADGRAAIVMEYHELGSLHDRLTATGPLPVADVVKAASAVADALDFAHSQGILHRDVKPQNVLVLPTSFVLADFGIARMADAGHTASLERFSYRHASPQVLDGAQPTAADDIWSLGSTVSTLLDGRAPFAADDPADDTALAYLGRVRRGQRRPLRRDDVPAGLVSLIDQCLATDPADRPVMAELRRQLGVLASEEWAWQPGAVAPAPAAPPVTPPAPSVPPAPVVITPAPTPAPEPTPVPTPAPEPIPAPVVAPVVAPSTSAMAHITPATSSPAPVADAEPTGAVPAQDPVETPDPVAPGTDGNGPGSRRFRVVAVAVVALLLGLTVGILAKVMGGDGAQAPTSTPTRTAASVPTVSTPPSGTVTSQPVDIGNAKLAPTDLQVVDKGSALELSWKDQTGGRAQFLVVDVTGGAREVKAQLARGATAYTLEGVDPAARSVCLQVAALVVVDGVQDGGATRPRCIERK